MLGRNHDYNVYEADCYIAFKNPLVDPNDKHPFFSMAKRKPMKVIFGTKTIINQIFTIKLKFFKRAFQKRRLMLMDKLLKLLEC